MTNSSAVPRCIILLVIEVSHQPDFNVSVSRQVCLCFTTTTYEFFFHLCLLKQKTAFSSLVACKSIKSLNRCLRWIQRFRYLFSLYISLSVLFGKEEEWSFMLSHSYSAELVCYLCFLLLVCFPACFAAFRMAYYYIFFMIVVS